MEEEGKKEEGQGLKKDGEGGGNRYGIVRKEGKEESRKRGGRMEELEEEKSWKKKDEQELEGRRES